MKARTLNQTLYLKWKNGELDLHEVAREFHTHGWTNFVDDDYARRQLLKTAAEMSK
jgi:hypothetical protein